MIPKSKWEEPSMKVIGRETKAKASVKDDMTQPQKYANGISFYVNS